MNKKQGIAVGVPVVVVLAVLGANWSVDFSQTTNIGQIGDNINTFIQNNLGVDVEEFKRMCDAGTVDDEFEKYCRLV